MKKPGVKFRVLISILTVLIDSYCLFIFMNNYHAVYSPVLPRTDISYILGKKSLDSSDYSLILDQTGLGSPAIDDLLEQTAGKEKIMAFQQNYYKKNRMFTEKLNPFTSQETLILTESGSTNPNGLAPLKNGDILFTKSTETLYWRHGHCGIVIDAEKGITLESLEPGTLSMKQYVSKWQYYPSFKIMRLKGADEALLNSIAEYCEKSLNGIQYNILASKVKDDTIPLSVNCSQLIWQAFYHFGYDIDSNKGLIVTPEDIAKSPLLETVQVKGFNPNKAW